MIDNGFSQDLLWAKYKAIRSRRETFLVSFILDENFNKNMDNGQWLISFLTQLDSGILCL